MLTYSFDSRIGFDVMDGSPNICSNVNINQFRESSAKNLLD